MSEGESHLYTAVRNSLIQIFVCFLHSCGSRAVVRKGNTTSDTVCEPVTSSTQGKELHTKFALTFASRMTTTLHSTSALELTGSTQSATNSVFNYSTKSPTPDTGSDFQTGTLPALVF